jgi:hypothetical protein
MDITTEADNILNGVADTCNPNSPLFEDRVAIEKTPGLELVLIMLSSQYKQLLLAKLAFGIGVYLGLQHQRLKNLSR